MVIVLLFSKFPAGNNWINTKIKMHQIHSNSGEKYRAYQSWRFVSKQEPSCKMQKNHKNNIKIIFVIWCIDLQCEFS